MGTTVSVPNHRFDTVLAYLFAVGMCFSGRIRCWKEIGTTVSIPNHCLDTYLYAVDVSLEESDAGKRWAQQFLTPATDLTLP